MTFAEYEVFELAKDLNPNIPAGMRGVVLEIYNLGEAFEVEFVKPDGTNHEYDNQSTFTIRPELMKKVDEQTG